MRNYVPRLAIFIIDFVIAFIAFEITATITKALTDKEFSFFTLDLSAIIVLATTSLFFFLFKSYSGLIRYSGFKDAVTLFYVTLSTVLTVIIINHTSIWINDRPIILSAGVIIYGFILFTFLFLFRVLVKHIYRLLLTKPRYITTYILGTSPSDVAMADSLMTETNNQFHIVGFLDDHESKLRNRIFNLPILNQKEFEEKLQKDDVVIVSEENLKLTNGPRRLISSLLELKVKIYKLPILQDLSKTPSHQLKEINLEDLLQRSPIKLNLKKLSKFYQDKVILVTGAAGSIGSEIVRQLVPLKPKKILLLDQAETPLHIMQLNMRKDYSNQDCEYIIANVRSQKRIRFIFEKYKPQVVFHGAAYKHVPMMEANQIEALDANFHGTRNMGDLSEEYNVERFVFVSTDKAVNPTNIMGASKRAAEIYIQSLAQHSKTTFITTRFGNVLGSNGSVVPYFKRQIANHGPVTVTHPDVTRYFMTIDEACQLVLEAGGMGKGGEIYVFDMGTPIKIADLAKHMIRLSGLIPDMDIKIKYIGLRPGEKLYEELLADKESTIPTHHEKILIAKASYEFSNKQKALLDELLLFVVNRSEKESLEILHALVPEYHPANTDDIMDSEKHMTLD